jgi:DNA-binding response OmpR family regulator
MRWGFFMDSATKQIKPKSLIFVLEDDEDQRNLVVDFLGEDYQVKGIANKDQLFAALSHEQPDLILLDLMVRNESMYSLCTELKKSQSAKIMFVTGRDTYEYKKKGYDAGCDDFLVKPFSIMELTLRVQIWVTVRQIELRIAMGDESTRKVAGERVDRLISAFKQSNLINNSDVLSLRECERFMDVVAQELTRLS